MGCIRRGAACIQVVCGVVGAQFETRSGEDESDLLDKVHQKNKINSMEKPAKSHLEPYGDGRDRRSSASKMVREISMKGGEEGIQDADQVPSEDVFIENKNERNEEKK